MSISQMRQTTSMFTPNEHGATTINTARSKQENECLPNISKTCLDVSTISYLLSSSGYDVFTPPQPVFVSLRALVGVKYELA